MLHIKVLLVLVFSLWFVGAFSQSCDCPPAATCAPCAGGFTSLTLRFTGGSASTIRVNDQIGDVFNSVVSPGSTFTFVGSIPNDKFAGPSVTVRVNGVINASFDTNCGGSTMVGSAQGSFVVVAAESKTGGTVCCSPGIEDTELPVINNCPATITTALTSSCTVAVNWTAPTATDNCSIASFTTLTPPGSQFAPGTTTVTYTARDTYGNTATCTFDVVVSDNTLPVFTNCPSDIAVTAGSNCKAVVTWSEPVASDNCAIATTSQTHAPNTEFSVGVTAVTYTATDVNGNTATCMFNVTVTDTTLPVFSNCPADIAVPAGANCKAVVSWPEPSASDNCAIANTVKSHNPNDEFPIGVTSVTYTATDVNGNSATCTFEVTVTDNALPVFANCPADITIAAGANCKAVVNWTEPAVTDNCAIASSGKTHSPNDEFAIGTTVVTYTATDASGNTQTCSFNVKVEDTSAPIITNCVSDIIVTAAANCKAIVSWTEPSASDNCGMATFARTHAPGTEFDPGVTQVTYTATDIHGNTSTCVFTVSVVLTDPPEVSGCPANLAALSDDTNEAVVTWTEPVFTVRCGNLTIEKTHEPGSRFGTGVTDVVYTATDDFGNTATCRFKVTVDLPILEVEVTNVITPNGDGFNDVWNVKNLERYPDNRVTIFDRWGSVLFEASGYDNERVVWRGLNKSNALVPTGTYFYVLEVSYGRQRIKREGFIEVVQ